MLFLGQIRDFNRRTENNLPVVHHLQDFGYKLRQADIAVNLSATICNILAHLIHAKQPVSYTHLDVYKRQVYFCSSGVKGRISISLPPVFFAFFLSARPKSFGYTHRRKSHDRTYIGDKGRSNSRIFSYRSYPSPFLCFGAGGLLYGIRRSSLYRSLRLSLAADSSLQ